MELGLPGHHGVHVQVHVAMAHELVRLRLRKGIAAQFNLSIGSRTCSGQYNGGYPCVGSPIEYEPCATNVSCPSEFFHRHN